MKIAFIGQYNKNIEEIASRMAERSHEVFAYVASNNEAAKNIVIQRGVRLKHLPDFSWEFFNNFFATLSVIFVSYDVVHFQNPAAGMFAFLIKTFSSSTKIVTSFDKQNYKQKASEWLSAKFSDKVIVLNKKDKLVLRKKYDACVAIIPSGSDDRTTKDMDAIYRFGLRDKKYILTSGKLCQDSQTHQLIEVFKQLEDTAKTTNNFKLVIISKNFSDEEYETYLRVIANGRENIIFFKSENEDERTLQQLFSHAQMFVEPSISGSTKGLIQKALGYGLAVLVSDVKKNTAVIGKDGFTFEAKSMQSLRDRLAYLLSRSEEVTEMGNRAKQKIYDEFSWDAVTKRTIEVYEKCRIENQTNVFESVQCLRPEPKRFLRR